MKKNSIILNSIFFSSLLLNLLNLKFFEKTIIRLEYLAAFYLIGFIAYFLSKNKISKISIWNNFNILFFCVIVVGTNLTAFCLGLNLLFAGENVRTEIFPIVRKTDIPGPKYNRRQRTPVIIFKTKSNDTKRVEFTIGHKAKIENAKSIELQLSQGFFGFEIIRNSNLK